MTKRFFQVIVLSLVCICTPVSFANENALSQALTPNVSVTGQMTAEKFQKLIQQAFFVQIDAHSTNRLLYFLVIVVI